MSRMSRQEQTDGPFLPSSSSATRRHVTASPPPGAGAMMDEGDDNDGGPQNGAGHPRTEPASSSSTHQGHLPSTSTPSTTSTSTSLSPSPSVPVSIPHSPPRAAHPSPRSHPSVTFLSSTSSSAAGPSRSRHIDRDGSLPSMPPAHFPHPHRMDDMRHGADEYFLGGTDVLDMQPTALQQADRDGDADGNWHDHQATLVGRAYANTNGKNRKLASVEPVMLEEDPLRAPHPPFIDEDGGRASLESAASSATDESDFDWEAEDETSSHIGAAEASRRAKRLRKVYLSCLRLARPVRILLVGLFGTAFCIVPTIVVVVCFPDNPARAQVEAWSIWISIVFAAACGTLLFVDLVPDLALRLCHWVYGKVPEYFKTWVELFMAVRNWVQLTLIVTWAWISLSGTTSVALRNQPTPHYFHYVNEVLQALFGTSIVLLAEKTLLRVIAINFHRTAVKDRLDQNAKALRALDKLHEVKFIAKKRNAGNRRSGFWPAAATPGTSRPNTPGAGVGVFWGSSDAGAGTSASRAQHGQQQRPGTHLRQRSKSDFEEVKLSPPQSQSVSRSNSSHHHHHHHVHGFHHGHHHQHSHHDQHHDEKKKKVPAPVHLASKAANNIADALAAATLKDSSFYKSRKIGSEYSARRLARKLFENLIKEHDRHQGGGVGVGMDEPKTELVVEDFFPYFKTEAEAKEAFSLFDRDNNGDISKSEMKDAVQRIYRERRALATSLKDMSSAVSKLDGVLLGVSLVVIIFIWLLVFDRSSTMANIVPLSTVVVGFSFVFGNSAKTIFESLVFIFATHPYDVGDLVFIDSEPMFVKEFGMISTVFRHVLGQEIVAPNAMLATKKYIHNCRRSGPQWETTQLQINFETPLEVIHELRARMRAWIQENEREWGGSFDINLEKIQNSNVTVLTCAFDHKSNWQEWGVRWERRTKLMKKLKSVVEELGLAYRLPMQPVSFHPSSGPPPWAAAGARSSNVVVDSSSSVRGGRSPIGRTTTLHVPSAASLRSPGPGPEQGLQDQGRPPLRVDTEQTFTPAGARGAAKMPEA